MEAKKTEEALLPEGWKQQVGAENLLQPDRSSWRVKKTTRKKRIGGEIRIFLKSECWARTGHGDLTTTTGEKVVFNHSPKKKISSAREGDKERGFGEAMKT